MTEPVVGCVFCEPSELTFWEGDETAALLDPAPIVEGHALLYSRRHHPCAADAPERVALELDRVCDWLRTLYHAEYGAFTMFEHGRTGHCIRRSPEERICHHLHVHVLPLSTDIVAHVRLGLRTAWQNWSDVAELAADMDGYAVVESPPGRFFYPMTRTPVPHYLRTVAAELAGDVTLANWEKSIHSPASAQRVGHARARLARRISAHSI
jgi:diadenosine tetraphosphate (Ap4A) HIT family hydrolase